jgi:NADPH2:quinone reductase
MAKTKTKTSRAARTRMPAIPSNMKAAAIDRFGPPSVLKVHTLPVPQPGPTEILVALHAAGVGIWDTSIRDGSWRPYGRPKFPIVLGTDGAGIVVAKGSRVRQFTNGDRVYGVDYANPKGGFYAEFIALDVKHAAPAPRRLDWLQAGAAPVPGLTALQGIDDHLRVRRGQTVLIFGATGAVGTLAVQFAKRRRARVIATASSRAAARLVRTLGADGVVDPRSANVLQQLESLAPYGLDGVLALAGSPVLERCLEFVRPGGRVAYPNGIEPEPKRRAKVRLVVYDAVDGPRQFAKLSQAVDEARLRVPIAKVFPLAQAARAHAQLGKGHIVGRIALRIGRG